MYADWYQTIANTSNVLWGPLMEKAYAVIYGGFYSALNGGWAQSVLPMETGGSSAGNNPLASESAFIAAIQSPSTLLTLASWTTNYGFIASHDYAVISVTGSGSTALFQFYNPWGFDQPAAITWSQLTQGGFSLDGDTVVSSVAATAGEMSTPFDRPATGFLLGTTASPDADSGADTPNPNPGPDLVVLSLQLAASGKRKAAVPQGPLALGRS